MGRERARGSGATRRELLQRGAVGGVALSVGSVVAGCGGGNGSAASAPEGAPNQGTEPKSGGVLKVGVSGGAASQEVLDPHAFTTGDLDFSRFQVVYEKLTDISAEGVFEPQLAESLEPNAKADEWTIRLRPDVTWHDGSELTADDVVYSLQRILNPDEPLLGASTLFMVDPKKVKKVDARTVRIGLNRPWVDLPSQLGQRSNSIIKDGTKDFTLENSNGTGAFKLDAWTAGESYAVVRNDNYWDSGKPYLDRVEINAINELTARLNALQGGQVDVVEMLDPSQAKIVDGAADLVLLASPPGGMTPIKMNTQQAPFDDNRVRQAFRLLADRQKLVDSALQGFGDVGNDLFSPADPLYNSELAQREFDPEQAVALLKEAGVADQTFILDASDAVPEMSSSALVFAEIAKEAGVKVQVKKHPVDSYWSETYGKTPFQYTDFGYRPFFAQWNQSFQSLNETETNWSNPEAERLFDLAIAETDEARRKEIAFELQEVVWNEGGYVVYGFKQRLDGLRKNVQGLTPHIFFNLGWYGFKNAWLA